MTHWVNTMIDAPLSSELVGQTINFHGPQLQKIWEGERGESDLQSMAIKSDYLAFHQRQKTLNFQDRAKRLKVQQFIVRNANSLFDLSFTEGQNEARKLPGEEDCYAALPPFETFLSLDRASRVRHFYQNIKLGNIVIGTISSKTSSGLMVKVLSIEDGDRIRFVGDLQIKAFCPVSNLIPAVDKKKVSRTYLQNDAVCCEVIEVVPDADKLVLGMKGTMLPPGSDQQSRLGLIFSEDFPDVFRRIQDRTNESYDTLLKNNVAFNNPGSTTYLATSMGLQNKNYSHIGGLRTRFPEQEYASELRQVQASKWAFRSVADGIDHFKAGRHTEAFQCLNKALNIDPRNIEGLVARGALYANSGSFSKAIEDFEASLKLNPNHQNARKYMGETLVALGRSYEDDSKLDEAMKAYEKCLSIVPYHEEASSSIQFIKKKMTDVSGLPGITPTKSLEMKETLKQLLKVDQEDEEDKDKHKRKSKKKKERKSRKRRHRSSSSSSSSSSDSSRSSSSSSSSSSSTSGSSHSGSSRSRSHSRKDRKKRRKSKSKSKDGRERSLSPLSKRMALMDNPEADGSMSQTMPQYNAPLQPSAYPYYQSAPQKESDYEQRVRSFIEQTKGDLDYEDKVRKFLEETARWKKEKKAMDDKGSKKKKKKEKKSHDKEKSKKKKKDKKHRKSRSSGDMDKSIGDKSDGELEATKRKVDALLARRIVDAEEEFLYGGPAQAKEPVSREPGSAEKNPLRMLNLDSLKGLDDLESKLSAYYAKVETTGLSKRHSSGPKSAEKSKDKSKSSPKRMLDDDKMDDDDDDELHLRDRSLSPQRPIMSAKWKMQIPSVGSSLKKKESSKMDTSKDQWDEGEEPQERQYKNDSKGEDEFMGRKRKSFGMMPRKMDDKSRDRDDSPDLPSKDAVMERERGRRSLRQQQSRSRSRSRSSDSGKPPMTKKAMRSRSRSSSSRSRSRSRGRKYSRGSSASSSRSGGSYKKKREDRSGSPAGKKPGSPDRARYRSRSRSYKDYRSSASRSRSRSYDRRSYHSRSRSYDRSRSRSRDYRRSRSPDRRRDYNPKYQGRFPRGMRGTYYKPRFQNYKHPRGNFQRGRGFNPRYQNYRGRGFIPRGRGRGRGRFNNFKPGYNNRDYNNRSYDRRRSSRDRDSADRASSYEDDPMRKVNAEKDRINKYIEESGSKDEGDRKTPRRSEPLSEGERDDDDYPSRQEGSPEEGFRPERSNHWKNEGKWADKEKESEDNTEEVEDMDKFFSKVKASKESLKERKSVTKTWQ